MSGINATRDVLKDQLALAASEIEQLRRLQLDSVAALSETAALLSFLSGPTLCGRLAGWLVSRGWK